MNIDYIDVCIPYEVQNLARAYNRKMETSDSEWVLFLDHDVFINCNPYWYKMCLNAIEQVGHDAGWISAITNRIGNKNQLHPVKNDDNDILNHIKIAQEVYKKYGNTIEEVKGGLSGFFILTSKKAWKATGGFKNKGKGLSEIDKDYSKKIKAAGYKTYIMKGLYMYHLYKLIKKEAYAGF